MSVTMSVIIFKKRKIMNDIKLTSDKIGKKEVKKLRQKLLKDFLHTFPLDSLQGMTLEQYIIRKDSLPTLRGKLDLNATIQNKLCRKQEIGCEYDELSENNIFNQIIKATVFGLLKHGAIKKGQKTKLKNLMLFFSGIDIIELSTIKWNIPQIRNL